MRVGDLVAAVDSVCPFALAESWDNVGLLVGDPAEPLRSVMLTIDLTPEVLAETTMRGCNAVVAYHPPLFKPAARYAPRDLAYLVMRSGVAVVSPHTALDAAVGGSNDQLARVVGLAALTPLRPSPTRARPVGPHAGVGPGAASGTTGAGRVGSIVPIPLREFADRVKRSLQLNHLLIAGDLEREVARIAVCAGAGGGLLADALAAEADCLLCGELGHHEALTALRTGMTVVCTLHSNAERLVLPWLRDRLNEHLGAGCVLISERDREPFAIR
jgi:dinuclear metal center YbgI/SA1388 family protein